MCNAQGPYTDGFTICAEECENCGTLQRRPTMGKTFGVCLSTPMVEAGGYSKQRRAWKYYLEFNWQFAGYGLGVQIQRTMPSSCVVYKCTKRYSVSINRSFHRWDPV